MNKANNDLKQNSDISVAFAPLGRLLDEMSRRMTREMFQREIDRRLGALFRLSGIELFLLEQSPDKSESAGTESHELKVTLNLLDCHCDLAFGFVFPELSDLAKQNLIRTAVTILSDYLKARSLFERENPLSAVRRDPLRTDKLSPISSEATSGFATSRDDSSGGKMINMEYWPSQFAHKLRNPLTAILSGSSQLLATDLAKLAGEDRSLVESIHRSARIQKELIDRYLLLYGEVKVRRCAVDLQQVIQSITTDFERDLGIAILISLADDLRSLTTDPVLLNRVVTELLSNACEAGVSGEIAISVKRSGDSILIAVKNSGGVPRNILDDIFVKPFTTSKSGHSGLGLPIAKRYALLLGGDIGVFSHSGETLVTLTLPTETSTDDFDSIERTSQCLQS